MNHWTQLTLTPREARMRETPIPAKRPHLPDFTVSGSSPALYGKYRLAGLFLPFEVDAPSR